MFGRAERKLVKLDIQDVSLPPMDVLNEDDVLVVAFEQGKEFQITSNFKIDWLPNSGDMGAKVGQTISAVLSFNFKSGKYQELSGEVSVRKRKKGALGRQSGPNAFKKLAWTSIELHKYCTKSSAQKLDLPLTYVDEGEEHVGKGAKLIAMLSIQGLFTDETGTEVAKPVTTTTTAARSIENTKTELSEAGDLLRQRGEKLKKLEEDGEALMNDAGDYARMARQLASGGTAATKGSKLDRAAEIADRHAGSKFKERMKESKDKKNSSDLLSLTNKKSDKLDESPSTKVKQIDTSTTVSPSTKGKDKRLGESTTISPSTKAKEVEDAAVSDLEIEMNDDILNMNLDEILPSVEDHKRVNNKNKALTGGSDAESSGDEDDDNEQGRAKGFGAGLLAPKEVFENLKSGVVNGRKMLSDTVTKGGHAILNTGQTIVNTGVHTVSNTVVKSRANMEKVSHALVGGVKTVVGGLGSNAAITIDGNGDLDADYVGAASSHSNASNSNSNALSVTQRFGAEKEAFERTFAEYANVEFPKADIDATTTTEDLKVLEKLEAARLENITLREKAIQFEYHMAKYNFFVAENARLESELEAAEAALRKVDADLATWTRRLEDKSNESSSLLQELEVMKAKVAMSMAETASYKEKERLIAAKIADLTSKVGGANAFGNMNTNINTNGYGNNNNNFNNNNNMNNSASSADNRKTEECVIS